MRKLLCKRNGLVLAVVAAGALSVSVATAQSTASAATKPVNKKSSTANTSHATSSSTSKKHTSSKKSGKHTKKVKGQAAPTSDRITEIQDALAKKGVFTGTPTGKWDDSTVDAMKHFQTANGLTPSGKLDALTLQKLGLGSETAGIAAPTPPPNSANRLKNLSSLPQDPPEDSSTNRPEK